MKYIWNLLESKNWKTETKFKVFILICGILFGMLGLLLWNIVQLWTLKTLDWMLCFIGYSVIISYIIAVIYTYNHEFHDGNVLIAK